MVDVDDWDTGKGCCRTPGGLKNLDVLGREGATGLEEEGTSTEASGDVGGIMLSGEVPPVRFALRPAKRSS